MHIWNDEGLKIAAWRVGKGARGNISLPAILAKSEETLIILPNRARDREGRKALQAKNGP